MDPLPLMGLELGMVLGSGGGGGALPPRGERKTPLTTLVRAAEEDSDGFELLRLALIVLPSYQGRFEVRALFTTSFITRWFEYVSMYVCMYTLISGGPIGYWFD